MCLALNAYYEARGEPFDGQVAVGQVAIRRAGGDLSRVCGEIYRPHQFSWTATRPRGSALPHRADPAWVRAQQAARIAALGAMGAQLPDYSGGATHYHATHVRPYWRRDMVTVAVVGEHVFYRGRP
jgi:spore germination cell wall hydrolase CwlJ-like protein